MSVYRQQLEAWLGEQDVKAEVVFDIGGAQGNVKDRVKSWNVKTYQVLDLPEYDLNKPWATLGYFADVIFCLEVFEYLINPIQAMKNIRNCLVPGGKAYITFQFVYPAHNELKWDSLRYTESGVKRLAKEVNLKIVNIVYREDRSGLLTKFYQTDGMRAAREYRHHNATGFIVEVQR